MDVSNVVAPEGLEQAARMLGERWARRLEAERARNGELWPGTLEQARQILDGALGPVSAAERESLAVIVERCARAAWGRHRRGGARTRSR